MPKGLREVKRKIRSVKSTQQIARAMKMVASAKLQRSQNKTRSAQPYAETLIRITEHLAASVREVIHPFLVRQTPEDFNRILFIVFTSDKGLCGAFNANIVRFVESFKAHNPQLSISILAIGRYGTRYFRRRNWDIFYERPAFDFGVRFIELFPLFEMIEKAFFEKKFAEVYVVFTRFISTVRLVPSLLRILPVEGAILKEGAFASESEAKIPLLAGVDYIFEPSPRRVLEFLLPRFVRYTLFQALRESFTSENAARMLAMDNASKNALEMIDSLTLQYNKARQQAITLELLDIVGGAEALKG